LGVNVLHIESRPSNRRESEFEILVDVQCDNKRMEELVSLLRREVSAINLAQYEDGADLPPLPPTPLSAAASFGWLYHISYADLSVNSVPRFNPFHATSQDADLEVLTLPVLIYLLLVKIGEVRSAIFQHFNIF
jgi:hypothetical protein